LSALKSRYRLVILSNIDDDLFGLTAPRLGVEFNDVVTAEQARSYKPSLRNFELMIERLGIDRDRLLHVAGSMFHDVAPAKEFGLSSVWVNRHGDSGSEATWPTEGDPDLQAPDLATLVSLMGLR
jgi:2-haloacid dehalogenase